LGVKTLAWYFVTLYAIYNPLYASFPHLSSKKFIELIVIIKVFEIKEPQYNVYIFRITTI